MLQMYHAVMRFSLNKGEQAHVSAFKDFFDLALFTTNLVLLMLSSRPSAWSKSLRDLKTSTPREAAISAS